jgi:hypothetical protein
MFRRQFLRQLGISTATLPFLTGLSQLQAAQAADRRRQRLIFVFSPNGTLPKEFWPKSYNENFELRPILEPLAGFRDQMLILKGVNNQLGGPGSAHIRGMGCLLTGTELFNGNIQGGSNAPTGWAKGISIDQEIRNYLDSHEHSRTRFGSLQFGVAVPEIADPRTRMSYLGPNQPIVPISDPRLMFSRLYGGLRDRESVASVLDPITHDLKKLSAALDSHDRPILERHVALVREFEQEMVRVAAESQQHPDHPEPDLPAHIEVVDDNTPQISRIQIDLMVNALANDMARVATLQFFRATGQGRLRWLGIDEGHHTLSHEPDNNSQAYQQLLDINLWFSGEIAHLARRLQETPEPYGTGSMLDHTTIVWINELGKGNSHTLNDIPMVLIGGGSGFKMGRAIDCMGTPHNRLWLSLAHSFGHQIDTFGLGRLCQGGPLDLS